jgi:ElaB/YqjD/DUF883 family membrane-anchored ribosome-binding protein
MSNSSKTIEESKNALVKDWQNVVDDADKSLNQVVNSTLAEIGATRQKVESKLENAYTRMHDARIAATDSACHAADMTKKYVSENPWKTFGIFAAAGCVIGLWVGVLNHIAKKH